MSMYWTVFDVNALWHFLGSGWFALQYPLSSAAQRIVKNVPLGMTLSQLKYEFQWNSSPKSIRPFCTYINWENGLSPGEYRAVTPASSQRNPKRLNLKEQQTKSSSSLQTPQQTSTSVHGPTPVSAKPLLLNTSTYSPAASQISLLINLQSNYLLAETFLTNLPPLNST